MVEAEDFNLHYDLGEPAVETDIKMSTRSQLASSRELAKAADGAVSREMINATRKVKEKAEPELREAVKKGPNWRAGCCQGRDLLLSEQLIAELPKPRRAANVAIEEAEERGYALCQR